MQGGKLLVRQRIQGINALRSDLPEFGQIILQAATNAVRLVANVEDPASCDVAGALAGFARTVDDIEDTSARASRDRLAIGRVSPGVILAMTYVGMRTGLFLAAVNFRVRSY